MPKSNIQAIGRCDEGGPDKAGCDGTCINNQVICVHLTVKALKHGKRK